MGSLNPIYYNYSYCQVQVYHLTTLCFSNLFFVPFLIFFCIRLNQLKCLFFYISALLTCYNSVFFYCNGYFRFIVYVINLSQSVFIIIPLHIKYKHLKIYFHFIRSLLLTSIQFSLPVSQIPHYVVLFIKQFIFYGNINKKKKLHVFVVQSLSHIRLFVTSWTAALQASLSFTISLSLLKFMSIELVIPSNHLILCHPLLCLPSVFPSIRVFFSQSTLPIRWPKYWSFSFSTRPSSEYSGLISFRIQWFDLLAV